MSKLAGLIDGMASAMQVPQSRVRTAAAQLRKHRLLSTGPRGPGAPEMTPADATNLLLATMYDADLAVAEMTVANLRAAEVISCRHRVFGEAETRGRDFPRNSFFGGARQPLPLGAVLDTIVDRLVRYGTLEEGEDEDLDLEVVNLRLDVISPMYVALVHFTTHEGFWDVRYGWNPPEELANKSRARGAQHDLPRSGLGPCLWTSRSLAIDSLHLVADSLRNKPWDDGEEEAAPPYDQPAIRLKEIEPA